MVLAASDALITGIFAVFGAIVLTVGTVIVALLNRAGKAAGQANDGLAKLVDRLSAVEDRENDCLDTLEWSFDRIGELEESVGMTRSPPPLALRKRRAKRHVHDDD